MKLFGLMRQKKFWGWLPFVFIATLLPIRNAYAAWSIFTIGDIQYTLISRIIFGLVWFFSIAFGIAIAVETWALDVVLQINQGLVNSAPVKIGFPVVLGVANLAFVAGIIIIAIATILRQDKYGVKKILWKLVVMAVMVNFGLVICGAILNLSDQVSLFFVNSISPMGGGTPFSQLGNFASSLAGAFNPQSGVVKLQDVIKDPTNSTSVLQGLAKTGQNMSSFALPLISVLGTLGSFVMIFITLGVLVAMLLYRYIRLGMLLIVLPLAWTAWVFPNTAGFYKKWWQRFTQWAFFAPAVIFFLWLGLKISEQLNSATGEFKFTQFQSTNSNPFVAALSTFLGAGISGPIEQLLRIMILFGIFFAGITSAHQLGIKFADSGIKAIEGAGGWAKGKAMSYSKRGARRAYQSGDRALQQSRLGQKVGYKGLENTLKGSRFSVVANIGRGFSGLVQKGGADVVNDHKKNWHGSDEDKAQQLAQANTLPDQLAGLSSVGDLSKVKTIGGKSIAVWLAENHQAIHDFGQHDLEKNLKKIGVAGHLPELLAQLDKDPSTVTPAQLEDLRTMTAQAMKDGDPRELRSLMKNGALGLQGDTLKLLRKAMVLNMNVFSSDQFGDFTAGLSKEQKENLTGTMAATFKDSPSLAARALGDDNMSNIRDNGMFRGRGLSSLLWGEEPKKPSYTANVGTQQTTTTQPAETHDSHGHDKHGGSVHVEPLFENAPGSGGGGDHGGGGGGDHGGGHGHG